MQINEFCYQLTKVPYTVPKISINTSPTDTF